MGSIAGTVDVIVRGAPTRVLRSVDVIVQDLRRGIFGDVDVVVLPQPRHQLVRSVDVRIRGGRSLITRDVDVRVTDIIFHNVLMGTPQPPGVRIPLKLVTSGG